MKKTLVLGFVLVVFLGPAAWADGFIITRPPHPGGPRIPNLSIEYHHVDIRIDGQVARTTVDQVFVNNHHREIEGTYIFPIPRGASISDFSMYVGGEEIKGKILDRVEARRIYEDIVRRRRDPALLEYFRDGMFKASVYPIPANGKTRIKLHYSEMLELDGGICGYRYTLGTERAGLGRYRIETAAREHLFPFARYHDREARRSPCPRDLYGGEHPPGHRFSALLHGLGGRYRIRSSHLRG